MKPALDDIQKQLCRSLCGEVRLHPIEEGLWAISSPFTFPDGDAYSLYLQRLETGGWRLTDLGHTWMAMSYDNDVDKFRKGTRGIILEAILAESGVTETEGELMVDGPAEDLGKNLFRLMQLVTRIQDLTFLNRERAEGTFHEDLDELLKKVVPMEGLQPNYIVEGIPDGANYPVDFRVPGRERQVFVFGVTGRDKAHLVTIYLHHFLRHKVDFDSLCILRNLEDVPRVDLARLMNVAEEMVVSLDDREAIQRKLLKRTG
jgi:hypothetical protein